MSRRTLKDIDRRLESGNTLAQHLKGGGANLFRIASGHGKPVGSPEMHLPITGYPNSQPHLKFLLNQAS
jgi:hypothetical protein